MNEEEKKETKEVDAEMDMKKSFKEKINKKDEEIAVLKGEIDHWKNEYYRAYADTQNLRKALEKDHREAVKYRAEGFIEKLLPVIDSFNMALQTKPEDPKIRNYLTGFEFIYNNLTSAIESEGAKEIKPLIGEKFDEATMHAVDVEEKDGEPNLITKVYSVGMKLHDRIIRPAMVMVSKKPTLKEEKKESEKTDA